MKKHSPDWKNLERICAPAVIITFLCLLLYFHHHERVRFAEASKAATESVLHDMQFALEVEDMEDFKATAYSITGITKSGVPVAPGQVAADPRVIPLGSMIYVESPLMSGIYQVTDTGRLIRGKIIDIFIPNYRKSVEFGRRDVKVKVLRYGYPAEEQEGIRPTMAGGQ